MLGSFLEIGISTDDIGATYEAFRALGFTAVTPGEARGGGYAVVSDGAAYFGIYDRDSGPATLTFVRPDLAQYVRALRRRRIDLDFAHLGEQEFHEVGFRDPNEQPITLVEARTFSPLFRDDASPSACGTFLEFSVATRSLHEARAFWTDLGLDAVADGEEPHAWCRLASAGLSLGLHEIATFDPGPCFLAKQLDARIDYLRAKGFSLAPRAPHVSAASPSATLSLGAAATLYLVADPSEAD